MWYAPIREITAQLRKHPRRRHKVRNMGMELPEGSLPSDAAHVPGASAPGDAMTGPAPSAYPPQIGPSAEPVLAPEAPAMPPPASPRDVDIPAENSPPKRQRIPHDGAKVGPRPPHADGLPPEGPDGQPPLDGEHVPGDKAPGDKAPGDEPDEKIPGGPDGEGQGAETGPAPIGGLMPPLHDHCHCEIKTMPGGRKIWKSNGSCCQQCDQARDQFNQAQAQMFGE